MFNTVQAFSFKPVFKGLKAADEPKCEPKCPEPKPALKALNSDTVSFSGNTQKAKQLIAEHSDVLTHFRDSYPDSQYRRVLNATRDFMNNITESLHDKQKTTEAVATLKQEMGYPKGYIDNQFKGLVAQNTQFLEKLEEHT